MALTGYYATCTPPTGGWNSVRFLELVLNDGDFLFPSFPLPSRTPEGHNAVRWPHDSEGNDMSSEDSIKYTVYELWSYFSEPPGELLCCPVCENSISIKTIGPSKVVSKYHPDRFLHKHEGYIYRCKRCPWWAVRERWFDYELNVDPDYLVVGESDGSHGILPWVLVLENENLYKKPIPLSESIGMWFSHGRRRKQTLSQNEL